MYVLKREGDESARVPVTEEAVVKAFASSFFSFPLLSLSTVSSALCLSDYFRMNSKSTNKQYDL